jgi:hypothetical protein
MMVKKGGGGYWNNWLVLVTHKVVSLPYTSLHIPAIPFFRKNKYDISYTSCKFSLEGKPLYFLPFPSRCLYIGGRKKRNGDKTASVLTLVLSLSAIQFKDI